MTGDLLGRGLMAALLLVSAPAIAQTTQVTQGLVLDHVTIVDTRNGELARDRAIVIDNGKIARIVRAGTVTARGSAKKIDEHDKFVVPGYLDMHVHVLASPDPKSEYALMLASGITGMRQMSGSPELLAQRQQGKLDLPAAAPVLLAMPGTILTGLNASSPEAAAAEVRKQKEQGADFIKIIDVKPPAFFAALDEAKRLGLPFDGHLPPSVDVNEASQRGMKGIEHLGPKESVLLGCSTEEAALRRDIAQTPPQAPQIVPGPVAADRALRAVTNPIMATDPVEFGLMARVIPSYSAAKCRALTARFVANGTWMIPTLIRLRTMEFGDAKAYRADPNLRYVPAKTRALWEELAGQFPSKVSPETRAMLRRFFALQLRLVRLLQGAGVSMLTGTDGGGSGQWDISGFALHEEFDLLREAGLSPLAILQMTTLNGAKFLGREATMGSVAAGKDADLVVLDGNPIARVSNLHRIEAVVRAGTYYSKDALAQLRESAAVAMVQPK